MIVDFIPGKFEDKKLSTGLIVGIAVASTVLVMLVTLGLTWFYLRKKAIENDGEIQCLFIHCYG